MRAVLPIDPAAGPALALELDLSHGRPGATARVELHDRPISGAEGTRARTRIAVVSVSGCIDAVAARRLERALEDLVAHGTDRILVDCAHVRHLDFRRLPLLVAALVRLDERSGGVVLCGLSRYLRDLFRLAGCDGRVRCWPSARDLLDVASAAPEPGRERAS